MSKKEFAYTEYHFYRSFPQEEYARAKAVAEELRKQGNKAKVKTEISYTTFRDRTDRHEKHTVLWNPTVENIEKIRKDAEERARERHMVDLARKAEEFSIEDLAYMMTCKAHPQEE